MFSLTHFRFSRSQRNSLTNLGDSRTPSGHLKRVKSFDAESADDHYNLRLESRNFLANENHSFDSYDSGIFIGNANITVQVALLPLKLQITPLWCRHGRQCQYVKNY